MLKLRCRECGQEHKARSDIFPRQLTQMQSVIDKPETTVVTEEGVKKIPAIYTLKPVVMGYVCFKCVGKVNLSQLKMHIRKTDKLDSKFIITKRYIREFFERNKPKVNIIKGAKNVKKSVDQKAGGDGSKHTELLHDQ